MSVKLEFVVAIGGNWVVLCGLLEGGVGARLEYTRKCVVFWGNRGLGRFLNGKFGFSRNLNTVKNRDLGVGLNMDELGFWHCF
jgi:hypothetical protein